MPIWFEWDSNDSNVSPVQSICIMDERICKNSSRGVYRCVHAELLYFLARCAHLITGARVAIAIGTNLCGHFSENIVLAVETLVCLHIVFD